MPSMIEVDNLSKSFRDLRRGRFLALDRVSFRVEKGEVFGLLGPNGAGKTTAMRVLCTVLQPSDGSARVAGFDVVGQAGQVRRHIGFVSANTAVYDRMTAWEMVQYFGRLYGLAEEQLQERLDEVFRTFEMQKFRDCLGGRMSTGMRQRVSLARAVVHDPPVLIFDEPTAGLDVLGGRVVLETIDRMRRAGKCIIFSTHIMREVEKVCDRVAVIANGRLRACGTLAELRRDHAQEDLEELFFQLVTSRA